MPNLPKSVAFAEIDENSVLYELHPDEEALLSPHAGAKRRAEFRLGRAAANQALQRLGFSTPGPVLKGERREPLWPAGVIGSLSHSAGRAVAAAAFAADIRLLGVDLQEAVIRDYPGVLKHVATNEEQTWLSRLGPEDRPRALAKVFSAKESLYKAINGRVAKPLSFSSAAVFPAAERPDILNVRLLQPMAGLPESFSLTALEDADFVLTVLVLVG